MRWVNWVKEITGWCRRGGWRDGGGKGLREMEVEDVGRDGIEQAVPLATLHLALSRETLESSRRDMLGRAIQTEGISDSFLRFCTVLHVVAGWVWLRNVRRRLVGPRKWFVVLLSLCWLLLVDVGCGREDGSVRYELVDARTERVRCAVC